MLEEEEEEEEEDWAPLLRPRRARIEVPLRPEYGAYGSPREP